MDRARVAYSPAAHNCGPQVPALLVRRRRARRTGPRPARAGPLGSPSCWRSQRAINCTEKGGIEGRGAGLRD
eukprot:4707651-Pyramimonas_sp.AAC.1